MIVYLSGGFLGGSPVDGASWPMGELREFAGPGFLATYRRTSEDQAVLVSVVEV